MKNLHFSASYKINFHLSYMALNFLNVKLIDNDTLFSTSFIHKTNFNLFPSLKNLELFLFIPIKIKISQLGQQLKFVLWMKEVEKMGSLSISFSWFKNVVDKANFSLIINGQEPLQPRKKIQRHTLKEFFF